MAKKRYTAEEIEEANLARRERKTRKEREERRQGVKAETHARIQKDIRTYLEANGGGRDLDPGVEGKHPGQEQHPRRRVEGDGGARAVETLQEGQTEGAVESGRRRRRAS